MDGKATRKGGDGMATETKTAERTAAEIERARQAQRAEQQRIAAIREYERQAS